MPGNAGRAVRRRAAPRGCAIRQVTSVGLGARGSAPQARRNTGSLRRIISGPAHPAPPKGEGAGVLIPYSHHPWRLLPMASVPRTSGLLHNRQRSFRKPEETSGSRTQVLLARSWAHVDRSEKGQGNMGGAWVTFPTALCTPSSSQELRSEGLTGQKGDRGGFESRSNDHDQTTTEPLRLHLPMSITSRQESNYEF